MLKSIMDKVMKRLSLLLIYQMMNNQRLLKEVLIKVGEMEGNNWTQEQMLEVVLKEPDDFLKIRETLSRIGVASRKERKLYQSCHILHKQGRYYIVHFKELFALDGKETNLSENDIARRNTIANLLSDWGLVEVKGDSTPTAPLSQIKIISFKEKDEWILETKYNIGKKREE